MTTIAEPTHEPGVAPDDELEHEAEANDATPPSPPADGKQLFDASDYDREDLALPKIDGNQIDQISVKFSGEVFLDRSDPADVALYRKLQLGHDVTLHIEGRCSSTGAKGRHRPRRRPRRRRRTTIRQGHHRLRPRDRRRRRLGEPVGGDVHNADEIAVFRWTGVAGLPSHEPSMLCPLHGLVSRDRLAYHDAISAVVEANNERVARRRQFRSDDHISPPEAWLVAALWFYKEPPLLQHAAGRYDLDLYYAAQRLAVEVDGKNHIRRLDRDAQRDEILLEQHRIRTLRIKAHLILRDPLATAREVCRTLANINVDARENA